MELLEKLWFGRLGCSAADVQAGKVKIFPQGTLAGYAGAMAFRRNNGCIISVPPQMVEKVSAKVSGLDCDDIFNPGVLEELFGNKVDRLVGPAWQGGLRDEDFKPCHGLESRLLTEKDWPAFDRFLKRNTETEISHSALQSGHSPTVGVFAEGEIVAAASYKIQEQVAAMGILSDPRHRGGGYATKAVSHITRIALDNKLGIQYQTLMSNKPSIALAKKLGYSDFAETIAVRLKNI